MNTENDINAVLAKVKKLFALSTSSNPNEAALAASKAQELLLQYNLSLSQVTEKDESMRPEYQKTRIEIGTRIWRRRLLTTLARNNFCDVIYQTKSGQAFLVGQKHNY